MQNYAVFIAMLTTFFGSIETSHVTVETFTFPDLNLITKTELVVQLCEANHT